MADLLDELLEGVPNVGGRSVPSVFGRNAVSFEQANRLTADRANIESQLLETRSRFNKLRREEDTLRQGQLAMSELTQLDPANDPQYMVKVQDILARNPNASLDAAVSNFLQVQGGIFADAEADRDAEAKLLRDRQEAKRNFRVRRRQERILREDEKGFREQEEIENAYDQMSPAQRELFDEYSKTSSPKQALRRVVAESQTASEVNALLAEGIPESKIFGVTDAEGNVIEEGLLDDKGRVDPKKLSIYMGERKQALAQKELEDKAIAEKRTRLQALMKYQDELNDPLNEFATPERKKLVADSIDKLQRELGDLPPETAGAGDMKDTDKIIRKDIRESDRFFE